MPFIKTRMLIDRPLAVHRLVASDVQVLNHVAKGSPLTVANLELWVGRASGEQRGVLARIQKSLFEPGLSGRDTVVVDGKAVSASRATGQSLSTKQAIHGVTPEIAELRARLPDALWGQAHAREAFEIARQDGLSTTRRTSALMLMSGDVAHGKDEALAGFRELLAISSAADPAVIVPAKLIEVNLASATNSDVATLFGEGGPLDPAALAFAAKESNLLIRLRNSPAGQSALAARFNQLFSDESPTAKAMYLVADYDQRGSARTPFGASFGAQGLRQSSAEVEFEHLTPEVMIRYADRALTQLLTGSRLEGQTPVWDRAARQALAQILATKHEPLDELKPRLQQLVLSHIHTQTSFDPKTSVLKFELASALDDAGVLRARIDELHQPMASIANDAYAKAGKRLFEVSEVARKIDLTPPEVELLVSEVFEHAHTLTKLLDGNDEPIESLRQSVEAIATQTHSALTYGWNERVTAAQYERFEVVVTEIEGSLLELAAQPLNDGSRAQLHALGTTLGDLHTAIAHLASMKDDAAQGLSGATLLSRLAFAQP